MEETIIQVDNSKLLNFYILEQCFKLNACKNNGTIGMKIIGEIGYIATNCKPSRNYNDHNYKDYYGLYLKEYGGLCIPVIENARDIGFIFNDDAVVKSTNKSKIYKIVQNES